MISQVESDTDNLAGRRLKSSAEIHTQRRIGADSRGTVEEIRQCRLPARFCRTEARQADAQCEEWAQLVAGRDKIIRTVHQKLMEIQIVLPFAHSLVGRQKVDRFVNTKIIRPKAVGRLSGTMVGQINAKTEANFAAFLEFGLKRAARTAR